MEGQLVNLYILIVYIQVPSRPERFWSCGENKEKLKRSSWAFYINISKENAVSIILSGIVSFDDEINNSIELPKENSVYSKM